MNEDIKQTPTEDQPREYDFAADLTKDEFVDFSMMTAKNMGPLKRQRPTLILFSIYLIVEIVGFIKLYMQENTVSWYLLLMIAITVISILPVTIVMPSRIKKSSESAYEIGNFNGYYGEITVTPQAILKNVGHETVRIPLNEKTVYMENERFMAFSCADEQRSIVLPSRCMTPEAAKQVREAVFAQDLPIQRRIFARMEAAATQPLARRAFPPDPQTLYALTFCYNEEELFQLLKDHAWKRYTKHMPGVALMSCLVGLLMAMLQEQVLWFPGISLTCIFGYLLYLMLPVKMRAKAVASNPLHNHVELTDRGLEIRIMPSGRRLSVAWGGVARAVERNTCVEFFHSDDNMLRIPKRAIDDFEEFRRVVDDHMKT